MLKAAITEEMSIPEILEAYPQTETIFRRYGIQADGYRALQFENLFATARVHQLDLGSLLSELNQSLR